jgi:hypothetical protein
MTSTIMAQEAAEAARDIAVAASLFQLTPTTITTDYTVPAGYNAVSGGPITVGESVDITLADNSHWTIA